MDILIPVFNKTIRAYILSVIFALISVTYNYFNIGSLLS